MIVPPDHDGAGARRRRPHDRSPRRRRSLRTQLLAGFVAAGVIPLLVFALVSGTRLVRWAEADAARRLTVSARTVAERIDDYVERHRRGIVLLAAITGGDTEETALHLQATVRRAGDAFDGFRTLLVTDSTGAIIAGYAPGAPESERGMHQRSVADRAYFRAPMATNAPFVSDAFRGRGFGTDPIVAVASPRRGRGGAPVGVVEGSLDLRRFAHFARGPLAMPSGRIVVLDRSDRVVFAAGGPPLPELATVAGTPLGRALPRGPAGGLVAFDDGAPTGPWLAAVHVNPRTGWRVVVAQPDAVVRDAGRRSLATLAAGVSLALVLAFVLARHLTTRVARPLERIAGALRTFDPRTPLATEHLVDAYAPAEVATLGGAVAEMSGRVHAADAAQRASEARFRAVFDHAAVGIAVHDAAGRIVDANAAFERTLGYSADELRGVRAADLSPPEEAVVTREPVRALRTGEVDAVRVEKRFLHRDGRVLTCELTVSRLDDATFPDGVVGMLHDVTERRALEREMAWRATHDALTGLANRTQLHEHVAAALRRMSRSQVANSVAVLVLDLDEFKRVNDSLGHVTGDQLLCEVSRRLLSATRGCDLVARLGGDEFAIVLDGVDRPVDATIAARRVLATVARPVLLGSSEVVVDGSVGIAYATADDDVETLIRNADTAMYHAKQRSRATFDVFAPAMHAAAASRLAIEGDLRRALTGAEFRTEYQLIVDLATGAPVGAECLVRWSRDGVPVSPLTFIPVAEQTGLILPIGRWVLDDACRHGAAWLARMPAAERGRAPFSLTVNVSARQLQDPAFIDDVRDALSASGFDPQCLVLELTESVLMQQAELAVERLTALKALGIRLAVDDFGTGYSSLSYLQRLPVDILKIDKSFTDHVARGPRDAALVLAVIALADALSLRCVAEGIEDAEQRDALRAMGCAYGQGYHFARPQVAALAGDALVRGALIRDRRRGDARGDA